MSRTVNELLSAPLVLAVRLYQRFISPLRPPTCRFYPSCSAYAVTALQRFGPFRGGWLAARRLGRCHPWTPGGVDEVPLTWETRNDVRPEDFRPREDLQSDVDRSTFGATVGPGVEPDVEPDVRNRSGALTPGPEDEHLHAHEHLHEHPRNGAPAHDHTT